MLRLNNFRLKNVFLQATHLVSQRFFGRQQAMITRIVFIHRVSLINFSANGKVNRENLSHTQDLILASRPTNSKDL